MCDAPTHFQQSNDWVLVCVAHNSETEKSVIYDSKDESLSIIKVLSLSDITAK